MALTAASWVPPLTISPLFNSSEFRLFQQVRNNSSAHTVPPFAVTASDTVLRASCGGLPMLAGPSPSTRHMVDRRRVCLSPLRPVGWEAGSPFGRGPDSLAQPVVPLQEGIRWMRSCPGITWIMSLSLWSSLPTHCPQLSVLPAFHHHQPHYSTMHNLPESCLNPPPTPAPRRHFLPGPRRCRPDLSTFWSLLLLDAPIARSPGPAVIQGVCHRVLENPTNLWPHFRNMCSVHHRPDLGMGRDTKQTQPSK